MTKATRKMTDIRKPAPAPKPAAPVENVFPVYFSRDKAPAPVVRDMDALEQHFAYYDAA